MGKIDTTCMTKTYYTLDKSVESAQIMRLKADINMTTVTVIKTAEGWGDV